MLGREKCRHNVEWFLYNRKEWHNITSQTSKFKYILQTLEQTLNNTTVVTNKPKMKCNKKYSINPKQSKRSDVTSRYQKAKWEI